MLKFKLILFLPVFCIAACKTARCQSDIGLIYGEITLNNNRKYEGHIRWDKDKVMWNDLLYSYKRQNPVKFFLSGEEINRLGLKPEKGRNSWNFIDLWDPELAERGRSEFELYFGFIRQIDFSGDRGISIELKNGVWIRTTDDMDMNDNIYMYDRRRGRINLRLRDVKHIVFSASPAKLPHKHGDPIYGTVHTGQDTYSGYIIWGGECCITDFLAGKANNRTESHLYGSVLSVEKLERNFLVTLRNGRKRKLCCSDDLNRGRLVLVVKNREFGSVQIKMDDIQSVFFGNAPDPVPDYDEFGTVSRITGRITTTDNTQLRGNIIYDLDEAFDCEILEGEVDDIEYKIPFSLIKRISPKNENMSEITLKKGPVIQLSDDGDVGKGNRGCLLETSRGDYIFIPWKNIREISF